LSASRAFSGGNLAQDRAQVVKILPDGSGYDVVAHAKRKGPVTAVALSAGENIGKNFLI